MGSERRVPVRTPAELLTEQFYDWERRGRGWQVWSFPVQLEPPFAPFRYHYVPRAKALDDGRRPSLFSRLTDRLLGDGPGCRELSVLDLDEPLAHPFVSASFLCEMRWSLPADQEVTPEQMEQLLLALPRLRRPLSFEVVGTANAIGAHLVCGEEDKKLLQQQAKGIFPDSVLTPTVGYLESCFRPQGSTVIVEFGLAEEFMLPLRALKRYL